MNIPVVNTSCMHIQMFMSLISLKKTLPLVYVYILHIVYLHT